MKNILKFLILTVLISSACYSQTYDRKQISEETELNFLKTEMRGFESNGIIYFVENDMQTLTAIENEKVIWRINLVSSCECQIIGKPEIRYIKLEKRKISVVFGKHTFAAVNIIDGKITFLGSD